MVNALKKIFSPHPEGKSATFTMLSSQQPPQANEGKRGLEDKIVRALGAVQSF
jgi:hypothetical protein